MLEDGGKRFGTSIRSWSVVVPGGAATSRWPVSPSTGSRAPPGVDGVVGQLAAQVAGVVVDREQIDDGLTWPALLDLLKNR